MVGTPAATVVYWLLSVGVLLRPELPREAARPTVTVSSLTNVSEYPPRTAVLPSLVRSQAKPAVGPKLFRSFL